MDAIETLLTRGAAEIYPNRGALEKVLRSGKKLKLYQGFDPTGTQLHIGHMVGFRKLRQFQDLGHEVIFLIGDGTGQAGDPSGKKTAREKFFTRDELRKNGKDYVLQAGKIVRFDGPNPVKILYNGDWLNKLGLVEILTLAGHFTLQQMLERDLYQERLKSNVPLSLREFLYPLLQGYDSVAMEVDLELGGSDQMFNMLAGRTLVGAMLKKEKFVMTTPLLTDSKGIKIGKTEGNVIALTDKPQDFYAKIMSLGDDTILPSFTLLTDMPLEEIENMKRAMASGENPMKFKKQLAFAITKQLNSEKEAQAAQESFESFQKGNIAATNMQTVTLHSGATIADSLTASPFNLSMSEVSRLIIAGSIDLNDKTVKPEQKKDVLHDGDIIKKGKHTAVRIKIKK